MIRRLSATGINVFQERNFRTLCSSTFRSSITSHRDSLLLLSHILQVLDCALKLPSVDRLRSLAGVLEGDTKVRAAGTGGFRRQDGGSSVANLEDWDLVNRYLARFLAHIKYAGDQLTILTD